MSREISIRNEVIRKIIHMATAAIPASYVFFLSREQIVFICAGLFIILLSGEVLRSYSFRMRQIYEKIFGRLLRNHEWDKGLNGATLLFLGFLLVCYFFEKNIAVVSMLLLSVADSFAAILGRCFGKKKIFGKTYPGSITFFTVAVIIFALFFENIFIIIGVALFSTMVELLPLRINDNLSIPILSAAMLSLVT